jgi:hypothetical protein
VYPPPERRWPGVCAAYLLLGIVLALPGVPLYYYLDPAHKRLVVCVGTGIVLAFTLSRLVRSMRQHLEAQPASDFAAERPVHGRRSRILPHPWCTGSSR